MALTLRRWCLLLLLAGAAIAVAYLPPRDIGGARSWLFRERYAWRWTGSVETPRSRLATAAEQWAALAEQAAVRQAPAAGDSPVVIGRAGLDPGAVRTVDSIVRRAWRIAPRRDSAIRLRVVVWADSGSDAVASMMLRPQILLPELTDGHACLVLIPERLFGVPHSGEAQGWWKTRLRLDIGRAIAPCLLRAGFGRPGPAVAKWMADRDYDLGLSIDWAVGGNSLASEWWIPDFEWGETAMPILLQRMLGVLPTPYGYSAGAAACAGGKPDRCADLVVAERRTGGEERPIRLESRFGSNTVVLSRYDRQFLSSLIRDRGVVAFRRFWTSSLPVEAGFVQAYGQSLGGWTHDWTVQQEGAVELGAPAHPAGSLAGLLAAVVAVALTALAAGKREVS